MIYSAIISSAVLFIILLEIGFIGKYISIKQDMFVGNKFAAFVLGFVTYFAITFAVLFIFIFFKLPTIYMVVFFVIKDVIQIMFLLARREIISVKKNKRFWIDTLVGLVAVVGTVAFFNYITNVMANKGVTFIYNNSTKTSYQSWYVFEDIINKMTNINDTDFIYRWFGSMLIAALGYCSVMSFISNFSKKTYWWTHIFGYVLTQAMTFAFCFGFTIESQAGPFLVLFAIMLSANIIVFSRRRYATVFGAVTIAAWSFNQYLILVLIVIVFVTMVIYAILQKPKVSMFWVQLVAPIAIVSTFWINDFSRPLGLAISVAAILLYIFMVSIGRVKVLEKLNTFFLKMRYTIPIVVFVTIIIASITIGITSHTAKSGIIINDMTYLFYTFKSPTANYVQIAIYSALIGMIITYLVYTFIYKKKLLKTQLVGLICSLIILFALNPAFWVLLDGSVLREQFKYLSTAILPPLIILGFTRIHTVKENKKIEFI